MTDIGRGGAIGSKAVLDQITYTRRQDESSRVVYSMPAEVKGIGSFVDFSFRYIRNKTH